VAAVAQTLQAAGTEAVSAACRLAESELEPLGALAPPRAKDAALAAGGSRRALLAVAPLLVAVSRLQQSRLGSEFECDASRSDAAASSPGGEDASAGLPALLASREGEVTVHAFTSALSVDVRAGALTGRVRSCTVHVFPPQAAPSGDDILGGGDDILGGGGGEDILGGDDILGGGGDDIVGGDGDDVLGGGGLDDGAGASETLQPAAGDALMAALSGAAGGDAEAVERATRDVAGLLERLCAAHAVAAANPSATVTGVLGLAMRSAAAPLPAPLLVPTPVPSALDGARAGAPAVTPPHRAATAAVSPAALAAGAKAGPTVGRAESGMSWRRPDGQAATLSHEEAWWLRHTVALAPLPATGTACSSSSSQGGRPGMLELRLGRPAALDPITAAGAAAAAAGSTPAEVAWTVSGAPFLAAWPRGESTVTRQAVAAGGKRPRDNSLRIAAVLRPAGAEADAAAVVATHVPLADPPSWEAGAAATVTSFAVAAARALSPLASALSLAASATDPAGARWTAPDGVPVPEEGEAAAACIEVQSAVVADGVVSARLRCGVSPAAARGAGLLLVVTFGNDAVDVQASRPGPGSCEPGTDGAAAECIDAAAGSAIDDRVSAAASDALAKTGCLPVVIAAALASAWSA